MIKDLTSEAHWDRRPTEEEQQWLSQIAQMSPEPWVLNAQLHADYGTTIEPILTRDIDGWRANRYIGEIRHKGRTLVIEPRLGVEKIMSWIGTVLNVQVLPRIAAGSRRPVNVVTQLLAALWRASVLTAGQHALPRTGVKIWTRGLSVRGRLDVSATARRRAGGHRDLVSTRVARTVDNAPARAVVLADRYFEERLAGTRWRGPRLDEQLAMLRAATGPRPQAPTLHQIRTARYSPITFKWRRAAELSWRILNADPLGVSAHDEVTHGVLIDVAEIWELFVLHCTGLAIDQPVRHGAATKASGHLARSLVDPRRAIGRLYPDVLVGESHVIAVLDAKYKRLGRTRGIDREDLYQLHAYSSALNAPMAALVYPAVTDDIPAEEDHSPWETGIGTLSFLTMPTEKDGCVAKISRWFEAVPDRRMPTV